MYRGGGKNQPGIKQIQDNKNRKKRERLGEKKGATDTEGNRLSCKSSCWGKIWPISYLPWEHLHACGTLLYSLLRQCFYSTQHATQSLNSPAASFICCMPNAKTYTHSYSCNTWSFSPRETMHFIYSIQPQGYFMPYILIFYTLWYGRKSTDLHSGKKKNPLSFTKNNLWICWCCVYMCVSGGGVC